MLSSDTVISFTYGIALHLNHTHTHTHALTHRQYCYFQLTGRDMEACEELVQRLLLVSERATAYYSTGYFLYF